MSCLTSTLPHDSQEDTLENSLRRQKYSTILEMDTSYPSIYKKKFAQNYTLKNLQARLLYTPI